MPSLPSLLRKSRGAILLLALIGSALHVQSAALVFHLRNGDRITGEVVSERSDSVVVRSVGGKVRIPLNLIERREDPAKAGLAARTSATAPKATPSPAASPRPETSAVPAPPLTNAVALPWYHPAWIAPLLTNWNVNLQIGSDLGFGTSDRQTFYGNATALHRWDRVRNSATFAAAYGVLNGIESANRLDGSLKTDVDLGSRRKIYAFNLAGAGFDEIRRLDLQLQEGAGFGYKLVTRPKLVINTELGAQYQEFNYQGATRDRNLVSVRFGEDMTWDPSAKLKIRQTMAFSPNITDFTDFRVHFTLNLAYPLLRRTTLNLNVIDDYDTNPAGGVNNNDLTIQTTLGVSF